MEQAAKRVNLLFTSAGRRVELLRAFKRAFGTLGLNGNVVALDHDPLAPALRVADRSYVVPLLSSPDYVPELLGICRKEGIGAVFPLIDPDIPVLAANRDAIEATGARLAVAPLASVEIASDKWLTARFFAGLGLPIPAGWLRPEDIPAEALAFPLFVKPRRGSAGRDACQVRDAGQLAFFAGYVPDPIIQECLPGPEITTDVVCGLDGEVLSIVSRERIEVRWGEVAKGVTIHDAGIAEACVRIAGAFRARGPITVQCLMKDGRPHFTEINARLGGGAPLGIAAGADWPAWLIARLAGLPVDIPTLGSYRAGLYMTRFDESFFLTREDYERIAGHRL